MRMRLFFRQLSLGSASLAVFLGGCQTAPVEREVRGSDAQTIAIDTPGASGAQCVLNSVTVGRVSVTTPARLEVDRSPEIIVVNCRKRCYLDASAMISSEGQRLASGAVVYSYPDETLVRMSPAESCDAPVKGRGASPL